MCSQDGDPCTQDICIAGTGCTTQPVSSGIPCDADDDACTVNDQCDGSGTCSGTPSQALTETCETFFTGTWVGSLDISPTTTYPLDVVFNNCCPRVGESIGTFTYDDAGSTLGGSFLCSGNWIVEAVASSTEITVRREVTNGACGVGCINVITFNGDSTCGTIGDDHINEVSDNTTPTSCLATYTITLTP